MAHELNEQGDDILSLLVEIKKTYLGILDSIQLEPHVNLDEPEKYLDKALDNLTKPHSSVTSCASCSRTERVEDVKTFAKGQHISMPGKHLTLYNQFKRKLIPVYKHHLIVKKVNFASGKKAGLKVIHFTDNEGKIEIVEKDEVFDLEKHEIYLVTYERPRYKPAVIVTRAEEMLPGNSMGNSFGSYNPLVNNCEQFATWCVVGEGESFQVQEFWSIFVTGLSSLVGGGSVIVKMLLGLLRNLKGTPDFLKNAPRVVFGVTTGLYIIYCIVMTGVHIQMFMRAQMCRSCMKRKIKVIWLQFGTFLPTVLSHVFVQYLMPVLHVQSPTLIVSICVVVIVAIALHLTVPLLKQALQSPFKVNRKTITDLSLLNAGDVISFPYHKLEHVAIVTQVNHHSVKCIHYSLPSLFATRIVREETFTLDPFNQTIKLFDCEHLPCKPKHKVVELVKKRVGETKWSPFCRSDHLCSWAKFEASERGPCENWNDIKDSGQKKSTAFIRKQDIHLQTELSLGDVVKYEHTGILVSLKSLDDNYGRRFEMEMMVYMPLLRVRKRKYEIELNKHKIKVKIYHPAHCHPMLERVGRALGVENENRKWWTNTGFINHCIMRHQN